MTPRDWDNCMLLNSTPNRPLVEWWWYDTSFLHSPPSHSPPLVKRSLTFQNKCTTPGMVLFYLSYISIHISIPDWRVEIVFILWSKPSFVNYVGFFNANQPLLWGLQVFLTFQFWLIWVKRSNCCFIIALILHDDRKSPINQNIQTKLPACKVWTKSAYKQQSDVSSGGKGYSWPL